MVEPWLDTLTPDPDTNYPDTTPTPRHSDTSVNRHSVRHSDTSVRPVSSHLDSGPPRSVSSSVNGVKTKPTLRHSTPPTLRHPSTLRHPYPTHSIKVTLKMLKSKRRSSKRRSSKRRSEQKTLRARNARAEDAQDKSKAPSSKSKHQSKQEEEHGTPEQDSHPLEHEQTSKTCKKANALKSKRCVVYTSRCISSPHHFQVLK